MDTDDARRVLREMQASWRQELTDDQVAAWALTLSAVEAGAARAAVNRLRAEHEFFPAHSVFLDAVRREVAIAAEQQREREDRKGCQRCGGATVIEVSDAYVQERMAKVTDTDPVRWEARRRAFANSVYPCPACRPLPFQRWHEGHYEADHTCPECSTIDRGGKDAAGVVDAMAERRRSGGTGPGVRV